MTRKILSIAVIAVLAVAFVRAPHLRAQEKAAAADEKQTPLAKALLGTWILAGAPGDSGEVPASGGRLKFLTGRHWMITQPDPQSGVTIYHHGGSYTLNGNEYAETIEYANENTKEMIKQTFKFTIKIDGDTLTQTGIGNPFNEVWKRAR